MAKGRGSSGRDEKYVWHRPEFMERLDELASFAECAGLLESGNAGTVSKWGGQYGEDHSNPFPRIVCAAGTHAGAKKYLVKAEFAEWLVAHEQEILKREQELYKKYRADMARVKRRIEAHVENLRVAEGIHRKWSTGS